MCTEIGKKRALTSLESKSFEANDSIMTNLPKDIIKEIFAFLKANEACELACVSIKWNRQLSSDSLWNIFTIRVWPEASSKGKNKKETFRICWQIEVEKRRLEELHRRSIHERLLTEQEEERTGLFECLACSKLARKKERRIKT